MLARKLILFDIDGTLLTTNGKGRDAFQQIIEEVFGRPFNTLEISFAGKTDPQILGEILNAMGISSDDSAWTELLTLYCDFMVNNLRAEDVDVYPGVRELLEALTADPSFQLALLTGNLEQTAYLKLRVAGLDSHFPFGAFGSDHADRLELPAVAIRKAFDHCGYTFESADVVIVGDTERDILCARSACARSVAVCTGVVARSELESYDPDFLIDDLSDTETVLRWLADA